MTCGRSSVLTLRELWYWAPARPGAPRARAARPPRQHRSRTSARPAPTLSAGRAPHPTALRCMTKGRREKPCVRQQLEVEDDEKVFDAKTVFQVQVQTFTILTIPKVYHAKGIAAYTCAKAVLCTLLPPLPLRRRSGSWRGSSAARWASAPARRSTSPRARETQRGERAVHIR